uniref:La-kappaKTx1 n=1 Tax=Liocheles australasiae TaxID=431266 RepID=KKX21_LIOAU
MKPSTSAYALLLVLTFGIITSGVFAVPMDEENTFEVEKRGNSCMEVCLQHEGNVAECEKACNKG